MGERELLTFDELKKYLKLNRSTLYKFVQEGRIPAVKLGRQWRFDLSEIDSWLKQQNGAYNGKRLNGVEEHIDPIDADDHSIKTREKRGFFRIARKFPVSYSLIEDSEKIFKATGRNISEGGLFIETEGLEQKVLSFLKDKEVKVKVAFELPEGGGRAEVWSKVAWLAQEPLFRNKINMGLKFFDLIPQVHSRISSYILKHSTALDGMAELPISFPMRLESSVVIKRSQEEVYSLLTDIEKFPDFIEDINSVEIVEEVEGRVISEWGVDIDGVPLNWRQQHILDKDKARISFRMLQGDLERYAGQWSLQQLLTGTELKLTMIVDWGLPSLARVTEPILKEKINNYIQRILSDIKTKLWTENATKLVKFACIIHPLDIALFSTFEPGARGKSQVLIKKSFELTPPFHFSNITGIQSLTGKEIDGELILCTLLPEQILRFDNDFVLTKIIEAGKLAEKRGARIFGLAGYTAGVGKKGILVERALNIPVTTGTSYTIAVTIEGVLAAAQEVGIDLTSAKVAIVGATGSIGRICAQILSREVSHLTLVARNEVRLNELTSLLGTNGKSKIDLSTEIAEVLPTSDIVITVTSAPYTLINSNLLQSGSVVCDISLPKNVSEEDALKRKDILIIDGGLVRPPGDVDFHLYYGLPPGLTYACMAETMLLAMEEKFESYSLGGNVSLEKVREISRLAKKHGFKLARLRSFGKEVTEQRINEVRHAYIKRKEIKQ